MIRKKIYCSGCSRETYHANIYSKAIDDEEIPDEDFPIGYHYWGTMTHILYQCLGCDNITYCQSFHEPSMVNEINHKIIPYSTNKYFPAFSRVEFASHILINKLPKKISNLYKEVRISIENKAYILASAGLRAIIEGTYIDKNLSSQGDLEKKIDNLSNEGLLTKKDAQRLHSIRFLGNNAIHVLERPTEAQIKIALDIVNHYLKSIYYPDDEVFKNLDIQINTYKDFILLLAKHIKVDMIGQVLKIKEIIPKISKLCKPELLKTFTLALDKEVTEGRLKFLEKMDNDTYKIKVMNFFLQADPYNEIFDSLEFKEANED